MNNPLLDWEFLTALMEYRQREVYARITLLTQNELPIEYIEGRVTAGSISVDGTSALRRTCNLTLVLKNLSEVNQFNWTFKSKFKLEVGLKNMINKQYPDIIWFRQGIFILTNCNMNQSTNNYTITINGKDKMCLLNGDIGGSIPHSTDFGVEEYYDKVTGEVTYNKILLKDIIRNALQTFGGELPENIIINDLDEAGLELLEYRHETMPLYLFRDIDTGEIINVTLDPEHQVYINGNAPSVNVENDNIEYADLSNILEPDTTPSIVQLKIGNNEPKYNIIKFSYGDLAGYRLTDLTYAGELKCNIGESITSVLDKIVKMLNNFEYFYNLDGKFVFQKKHTYISTPWGGVEKDIDGGVNETLNDACPKINLMNAQLTTAFANNPNLLNIKNDFSVWGTYKSISGADIPIHMRYALDTKPTQYTTIRSLWNRRADATNPVEPDAYIDYKSYCQDKSYTDDSGIAMIASYLKKPFATSGDPNNFIIVDWREIIYQMALDYYALGTTDDFFLQVAAANPQYPTGKTGYEQYYTDLQGFWRQLYDPRPEAAYEEIAAENVANNGVIQGTIYLDGYYEQVEKDNLTLNEERVYDLNELYVLETIKMKKADGSFIDKIVFYPFIGSSHCCLQMDAEVEKESEEYWYYTGTTYESSTKPSKLNAKRIQDLYELDPNDSTKKKLVVDVRYDSFLEDYDYEDPYKCFWIKKEGKLKLNDLIDQDSSKDKTLAIVCRNGIASNVEYQQYLYRWGLKDNYGNLATPNWTNADEKDDNDIPQEITERITYLKEIPNGDYSKEDNWNIAVTESPDQIIFWFDFLETEGSDLYKYSVRQIGSRTKSINDSNVKSIYYRDVPNVIFMENLADELYDRKPGYTYIQLPPGYTSLFSISGRGKSAKERIDELLQEHSYAIEQTNITTVPLYHLEPNTRVAVKDEMSNVDGEYIVTKVSIPLTHNGTMSLSTTKVVSNIM